ncbi:MAG: hypothetical protein NTU73_05375 [Ignavibacteriae bacterium]|nr:hypothetical protein [Ignavibacteriota bacterium]
MNNNGVGSLNSFLYFALLSEADIVMSLIKKLFAQKRFQKMAQSLVDPQVALVAPQVTLVDPQVTLVAPQVTLVASPLK